MNLRKTLSFSAALGALVTAAALLPLSSVHAQKPGETKLAPKTTGVSSAPKTGTTPPKITKKLPARDPKTGRFVKATGIKAPTKATGVMGAPKITAAPALSTSKTTATTKKTPARDPKTGRFVKAGSTTTAPTPAKKP